MKTKRHDMLEDKDDEMQQTQAFLSERQQEDPVISLFLTTGGLGDLSGFNKRRSR